jgi:DNA topoisomerase-1
MAATAPVVDTEIPEPPDGKAVAEEAGLRYVSDATPGFRRQRSGKGFRYRDLDGKAVPKAVKERIDKLAIPPAWTDVWICPHANGHLQATGRDVRGRKQYRYHDTWRKVRDADKFSSLLHFGEALGELRASIDADLAKPGTGREQVLAAVVRLLDDTLIRVGNEEYAITNESFGLTTLRPEHVEEIGRRQFSLCFVGKSGVEHEATVEDPKLARLVRRCHELDGKDLFSYRCEDGSIASVSSSDVNQYLHDHVGPHTTAKQFRTWGASALVTRVLAERDVPSGDAEADGHIIEAIDEAAEQLRNTRAVCRQSYVHPVILDAYRDGELLDTWKQTRSAGRLDRADRTLLHVLQEHQETAA